MDMHERAWNRSVPLEFAVYNAYLRLEHTGMKVSDVLMLPDEDFAPIYSTAKQATWDAMISTYERDLTVGAGISLSTGFCLVAKSTENMVSPVLFWPACNDACLTWCLSQAVPCTEPQFLGRRFHEPNPIRVPDSANVQVLAPLMGGRPEFTLSALADDCESDGSFQRLFDNAITRAFEGPESLQGQLSGLSRVSARTSPLQERCKGCRLFSSWNDEDWELMTKFFKRGLKLVRDGKLSVTTAIGLATSASAGQEGSGESYGGHCFNVGRFQENPEKDVKCFILEGTAPMDHMSVTKDTPTVTVYMRTSLDGQVEKWENKTLDMATFLTDLAKTVCEFTRSINIVNGTGIRTGGWPTKEKTQGWIASKMFINNLDSDPDVPIPFYHRILYTGWQCSAEGVGCMPVEEIQSASESPVNGGQSTLRSMGVGPYNLGNMNLRGLPAVADKGLMDMILPEANPPMAGMAIWDKLFKGWAPCDPVRDGFLSRPSVVCCGKGARVLVAACMESPASPDYVPLMYKANVALANKANEKNSAKPDSDKITMEIRRRGTGLLKLMYVDQESMRSLMVLGKSMTFVRSLKEARTELGWPEC